MLKQRRSRVIWDWLVEKTTKKGASRSCPSPLPFGFSRDLQSTSSSFPGVPEIAARLDTESAIATTAFDGHRHEHADVSHREKHVIGASAA
jgi:hypothetical protein